MSSLPTYGTTSYPTAVPSNQQVVIPQITFPQPLAYGNALPNPQITLAGPQLNKVRGMDGAKQFQTVANGMYALFDDDDDVFYVKVTDKNNYPISLKRYRFFEEDEPVRSDNSAVVTKDEYSALVKEIDSLKEEIRTLKEENANAKQSVRSKTAKSTVVDTESSSE